jgi:hypothetical protein
MSEFYLYTSKAHIQGLYKKTSSEIGSQLEKVYAPEYWQNLVDIQGIILEPNWKQLTEEEANKFLIGLI